MIIIIIIPMFVASIDEPKESNNSLKDGVAHVQGISTIDYMCRTHQ